MLEWVQPETQQESMEVLRSVQNQDHIISRDVFDKIDVYIQKNAKVNPQMDIIPNGIHLDGHFIFSVRG